MPESMTMPVAEAAKELGVSEPRVHQFIKAGMLSAKHINPRFLMLNPRQVRRLAKRRRPAGRPRKNFQKS